MFHLGRRHCLTLELSDVSDGGSVICYTLYSSGSSFSLCGHGGGRSPDRADSHGSRSACLATAPHRSHMVGEDVGERVGRDRGEGEGQLEGKLMWGEGRVSILFLAVFSLSLSISLSLLLSLPFFLSFHPSPLSLTPPLPLPPSPSPSPSDRHGEPPGRFLSAGLLQQRCSVM